MRDMLVFKVRERLGLWAAAAAVAALGSVMLAAPQSRTNGQAVVAPAGDDVEVLPVQRNVYAIFGAGGNIVFEVGRQGIILVNTGDGRMNEKVVAAIRRVSDAPVRFIIATSIDPDHLGGNEAINKAIGDGLRDRQLTTIEATGAEIIATEQVLLRMSAPTGAKAAFPTGAWPTLSYFTPRKDLYFNDQAIQLYHLTAHTDGDTLVYFRRADVIVAGDIFDRRHYPVVDQSKGGNFIGVVNGLNQLLDISVSGEYEEGGTMVIPGHGRICDEADVVEYRDMMTIIRDRIQDLVKKGKTLDEVKAMKPTLEYDRLYGSTTGPWTTDMFIEAAYRDLSAAAKAGTRP